MMVNILAQQMNYTTLDAIAIMTWLHNHIWNSQCHPMIKHHKNNMHWSQLLMVNF